jgi:uridine kinase
MIGDNLTIKQHHLIPAKEIYQFIASKIGDKYAVAIGGESGSGKSTLAVALKRVLEENGHKVYIFHMDDYFLLPPARNHQQRLNDIGHVGPQEVNLALLQKHINTVKHGMATFEKPLVYYKEDEIRSEHIDISSCDIILVEGTYVLDLEVDLKIFLGRNYHDTLQDRIERARDPLTPFVESVLEIEHTIIRTYAPKADLLLDKNYNIKFC